MGMSNLLFSMSLMLDNTMMATMGKLAVEVAESSFEATQYKRNSAWFCTKCAFSTQNRTVDIMFIIFMIISICTFIALNAVIIPYGWEKKDEDKHPYAELLGTKTYFNWYWSIVVQCIWVPFLLTMGYFFVCLMHTLTKCFSMRMTKEKAHLRKVFGIIMLGMIFRLAFSVSLGFWYKLIC